VRIEFDPSVITYRQILEIFFTIHDPTTLNRQGNDVGTQYRSVIYTHSPEQEQVANDVIAEVAQAWPSKVVT
jgi:peptide-methionine (S)-S-oxide reductase